MMRLAKQVLLGACCVTLALTAPVNAQDPGSSQEPTSQKSQPPARQPAPNAFAHRAPAMPSSPVSIDGSEAMFTTMCALLASGFESNVDSREWRPIRTQLRDRMQHQQGLAVEAARQFYKQHQLRDPGAMLSQYIWFGLVSGPAPNFQPTLRRDDLPPEVIALDGFSEILSAYYKEQNIGALWRQLQPLYTQDAARMHDSVAQIVFLETNYLREMETPSPRTFTVVVEPLVGRITNVRNFGDHYALIVSGPENVPLDVIRHAYLHFLLDPLPLRYSHVIAVKQPLFQIAAAAPRLELDLKDDFSSYFAECLVRAVELRIKRVPPSERDSALNTNDTDGYVLVRPLYNALDKFEKSEPSMPIYFPEMVRSIDVAAETKRLQTVIFAPVDAPRVKDTSSEAVARRKQMAPSTIPNDQEAIAALTEGERRIAEKNPRAAEISFQRVLAKFPDQPRAWYGLGLVALMDHDGERAKEVFGRLTEGDHAATKDPLVLTWSHVYLARIYDDEGHSNEARNEYEAALAVSGAPAQAREAAQKGLASVSLEKPAERP